MRIKTFGLLLTLLLLVSFCQANFQMWKQCDQKWGSHKLGFSPTNTICSSGALVTSITMAVTSMPTWINPGDTNQWLKNNKGFTNEDHFIWTSLQPFGLVFGNIDSVIDRIGLHLLANHFVIANVMNGAHWVLVTGGGNGYFTVNDPKFEKAVYNVGEVSLFGWYSRIRQPMNLRKLQPYYSQAELQIKGFSKGLFQKMKERLMKKSRNEIAQ